MVVNSSRMNFKEVVDQYLNRYQADVWNALYKSIEEVSKETVARLKSDSKAKFGNGKYAKGWTRKVENGRTQVGATVYGKTGTYQLAHLLENGHVTRNGSGRKFNDTPAHVHIAPVAEWAIDEAIDRAITSIERASR